MLFHQFYHPLIKGANLISAAPQEMIRDNLCCFNCHMYLYDILTKATVLKKKIPVLILCNKTDKVTAHSKEFIRKQLEKEL